MVVYLSKPWHSTRVGWGGLQDHSYVTINGTKQSIQLEASCIENVDLVIWDLLALRTYHVEDMHYSLDGETYQV